MTTKIVGLAFESFISFSPHWYSKKLSIRNYDLTNHDLTNTSSHSRVLKNLQMKINVISVL